MAIDKDKLRKLLQGVAAGETIVEEAMSQLNPAEVDLGFARLDLDRKRRRGLPEVIFCPGKTSSQLVKIVGAMCAAGQDVLATRATPEQYAAVHDSFPKARYNETARAITVDVGARPAPFGLVAIVCAGTSDLPVAEEAAITARHLSANVERIFDVGVAGLHRLMPHLPLLSRSRAIVVGAGMEGALPSVVAGLVDRPVIAVPTSVGYGSSLNGLAALLAMLNSCVPGVTVVNIDNGFGAGVAAGMINRGAENRRSDDAAEG